MTEPTTQATVTAGALSVLTALIDEYESTQEREVPVPRPQLLTILRAAREAVEQRAVIAAARELKHLAMQNGANSLGAQMAERKLFAAAIKMPSAATADSSAPEEPA